MDVGRDGRGAIHPRDPGIPRCGVNFIDTAPAYGLGLSERIVDGRFKAAATK